MFALPDEYCEMLDINIGDILLFTILVGRQVSIDKHSEQDLSDAEIEIAGNLSRVVETTNGIVEKVS